MSAVAGRPRILSLTARIEEAETILITIRDTGVGIQADAFDKIFEPFFTTKETGMGLGLAICRWIVATHGGELWASPNQGSGTIFYLRLPAKQGADSPPEPPLEIPEFRMSGGRE
jgi:signal transduction histidine kinase